MKHYLRTLAFFLLCVFQVVYCFQRTARGLEWTLFGWLFVVIALFFAVALVAEARRFL